MIITYEVVDCRRSSTDRKEVDIVIEDAAGRIVGVEVRATSTPGQADFRGLRALKELAGERFVRGIMVHLGDAALPFGERLEVVPAAALSLVWRRALSAPSGLSTRPARGAPHDCTVRLRCGIVPACCGCSSVG